MPEWLVVEVVVIFLLILPTHGKSLLHHLGVSKNRGTPKWMGMIWGYHYFRKHPFGPCFFSNHRNRHLQDKMNMFDADSPRPGMVSTDIFVGVVSWKYKKQTKKTICQPPCQPHPGVAR